MHSLLPLAIFASISFCVLSADSGAPSPLTTSTETTHELPNSRAKRGGKINYRRLARGLHMIRLGKRGENSSPLDVFDDKIDNNDSQLEEQLRLNALFDILSQYKDELASLPLDESSSSDLINASPFDDIDSSLDGEEDGLEGSNEDDEGLIDSLPSNFRQTLPFSPSSETGSDYYDAVEPSEKTKRGLSMLRLGKRGLSMLRLGKRDSDGYEKKQDEDLDNVYDVDDKRSMAMLRLGKRPMSMLRLGKRPMSMLRLGKRPMSMLRLGKRPMSMLRLGKRPMSMLRLGKRPMSMLRLGKRGLSMLRLGKRPMSMLRLGKRPMSMLRLGKRSIENEPGQ